MEDVKRLAIYFLHNADGIVDRYVYYMLNELKKSRCQLCVAYSGELSSEGRKALSMLTTCIFSCSEANCELSSYKAALTQYGWGKLAAFDEVVLVSSMAMGPVFPLNEMFSQMDLRELDFWGITKQHATPNGEPANCHLVAEHIQCYFTVIRKHLLQSEVFRQFWNNVPCGASCFCKPELCEASLTTAFADAGYAWDVFVNTEKLEGFVYNPILMDPVHLLCEYRCPVFLRSSFVQDYHAYLDSSIGNQGRDLLRYLEEKTQYDTGMIWENLLRTANLATLKECINLNYILSSSNAEEKIFHKKTALVIHLYFEDLVDYCYRYALSMPADSDIYITTGTEAMRKRVEAHFSHGPWKHIKIIPVENRGRDVSALLVGAAPYLSNYDYVCFVHDKKVSQLNTGIKGYSFSERCFQNLLGSKGLVRNILSLFEGNTHLGMLFPPIPYHGEYYPLFGDEWGPNYSMTETLVSQLKLNCPISPDRPPVAPLGTMFWFRPIALQKILEYGWHYTDFPEEPIETDGTLLHAVERVYPFAVQDAGYYCGWVMNAEYAEFEWNNLSFMLREINMRALQVYGGGKHSDLIKAMECWTEHDNDLPLSIVAATFRRMIKQILRRKIPEPVWKAGKRAYHLLGGEKWKD